MKLVVGLGNPGPRYAATRHNAGYRVVEAVAARCRAPAPRARFEGSVTEALLGELRLLLLCPATSMNASGRSVAAALAEHPELVPERDLLVVLDDLDLPLGRLRLRAQGGDGGHRGLRDVLLRTGPGVARLRFGIGRPPLHTAPLDYVLAPFGDDEAAALARALERAADAVACFAREGAVAAMQRFNAPDEPTPGEGPG